jgi:hypothetical protein
MIRYKYSLFAIGYSFITSIASFTTPGGLA